ncbi:MAG: HK97 family phage prohead protease [Methylobacteriaceae bacterium]|nr:HK97 family phage prohead protease [Methylobacteriaceae bacterium]
MQASFDALCDLPAGVEIKRAASDITSVAPSGAFEGYARVFGIVDAGRDEVVPGAFAASLQKRGAGGVKMLWQHRAAEPIGQWTSIAEDRRGLRVTGRLNLAVARAREVLALMRERAVDGLSIGFKAGRSAVDRKTGIRRLYAVDLWEISVVTFPMLPQARIIAVKEAGDGARQEARLLRALREGARLMRS